ncbi:MAG: 3-alpha,7-alpha,12-alpha-trihydroxy-5-beta-cholest-24-enoyl-CoA hydratase [Ahrensia sp.]|nr:3-alpha,7-alpha,12-alpha-trihydroxy-5-beta-cholest-24-enoyl-CoA hydratase [Ahrensia sp.]
MAFNHDVVATLVFPPVTQTPSARDCQLYALSVGFGQDPTDRRDLPFVYEKHLRVAPTMAAVLCTPGHWVADPKLGIDADSVLHGEQSVRLHRAIPVGQPLTGHSRIVNVWDKGTGKGALVELECQVSDANGTLLWTVNRTAYLRGEGGYGGAVQPKGRPWTLPNRKADIVWDFPTSGQQALLYRLNGDLNPVHADPDISSAVGFPQPVLHGLCSYGIAGCALLKTVCEHDESRVRTLSVRFSAPAFPGDTIRTSIWREGSRALFTCTALERGVQIITNGTMELHEGAST